MGGLGRNGHGIKIVQNFREDFIMNLIRLMIVLFVSCGVSAIVLYIFSFIMLIKGKSERKQKVKGSLCVILATVLAYVPLKYIFGLFVLRTVIVVLIGIDIIMIYKFWK